MHKLKRLRVQIILKKKIYIYIQNSAKDLQVIHASSQPDFVGKRPADFFPTAESFSLRFVHFGSFGIRLQSLILARFRSLQPYLIKSKALHLRKSSCLNATWPKCATTWQFGMLSFCLVMLVFRLQRLQYRGPNDYL